MRGNTVRTAFVKALTALAAADPRVMLVTGDLGFGVLTDFASRFPNQWLNAGVAEQNMTGLATGLALSGRVVFTYSIGNFPLIRCLEQVRNDVCYHKADVKIVCVGGGMSYGPLGVSHHATEDLAIARVLPNLTVLAPGDPVEAEAATRAAVATPGPFYLRLGKAGEPVVHKEPIDFRLGRAIVLRRGSRAALLSTGGVLPLAVEAARRLQTLGLDPWLVSVPCLKPLDVDLLRELSRSVQVVATIEEHSVIGGLGGAVAEVLAENPGPKLVRVGLPPAFTSDVGSQEWLRARYGLTPERIVEAVQRALPTA